jgi:hypothetical protein
MTCRKNFALAFSSAVKRGVRQVSEGLGEIFFEKVTASERHGLGSTDMLYHNIN